MKAASVVPHQFPGIATTYGSVTTPARDRASASRLYRAINAVAQQMVDDGLLSQKALDRFVFALWFPTAADVRAPVDEDADLSGAFEVVEAAVAPAAVNPQDVFVHEIDDPAAYAKSYAGYIRGFAESSLRLHLFGPSADDKAQVDMLTETFFKRLTAYYEAAPGRYASETMIVTLILRRR